MVVPRRDDDDVPTDKAWAIHAAIILSLTAIGVLMFETHVYVGGSFFAGCIVAFFLLRAAMNQAEALATSYAR